MQTRSAYIPRWAALGATVFGLAAGELSATLLSAVTGRDDDLRVAPLVARLGGPVREPVA
jgi:hypothetical protein